MGRKKRGGCSELHRLQEFRRNIGRHAAKKQRRAITFRQVPTYLRDDSTSFFRSLDHEPPEVLYVGHDARPANVASIFKSNYSLLTFFFFFLLIQQAETKSTMYRQPIRGRYQADKSDAQNANLALTASGMRYDHKSQIIPAPSDELIGTNPVVVPNDAPEILDNVRAYVIDLIDEGYLHEAKIQLERILSEDATTVDIDNYGKVLIAAAPPEEALQWYQRLINDPKGFQLMDDGLIRGYQGIAESLSGLITENQAVKTLSAFEGKITSDVVWRKPQAPLNLAFKKKEGVLDPKMRPFKARFQRHKADLLEQKYNACNQSVLPDDPERLEEMLKNFNELLLEIPEDDYFFNSILHNIYVKKAKIELRIGRYEEAKLSFEKAACLRGLSASVLLDYADVNRALNNHIICYRACRMAALEGGSVAGRLNEALDKILELGLDPFEVNLDYSDDDAQALSTLGEGYRRVVKIERIFFGPVLEQARKKVELMALQAEQNSKYLKYFLSLLFVFFVAGGYFVKRYRSSKEENEKKLEAKAGLLEHLRKIIEKLKPLFEFTVREGQDQLEVTFKLKKQLIIVGIPANLVSPDLSLEGVTSVTVLDAEQSLEGMKRIIQSSFGSILFHEGGFTLPIDAEIKKLRNKGYILLYKAVIKASTEYIEHLRKKQKAQAKRLREQAYQQEVKRLDDVRKRYEKSQAVDSGKSLGEVKQIKKEHKDQLAVQKRNDYKGVRIDERFYKNIVDIAEKIIALNERIEILRNEIGAELKQAESIFGHCNSTTEAPVEFKNVLVTIGSKLSELEDLENALDNSNKVLGRMIEAKNKALEVQRLHFQKKADRKRISQEKKHKDKKKKDPEAERARREAYELKKSERKKVRAAELKKQQEEKARQKQQAEEDRRRTQVNEMLKRDTRVQGINVALDGLQATLEQRDDQFLVPGAIQRYLADPKRMSNCQQRLGFLHQDRKALCTSVLECVTRDSLIGCLIRVFEGLEQVLRSHQTELALFADFKIIDCIRQNLVHRAYLAEDQLSKIISDVRNVYCYFQPLVRELITCGRIGNSYEFPSDDFRSLFIFYGMGEAQERHEVDFCLRRVHMLCQRLSVYAGIAREIEQKVRENYYSANVMHQAMASVIAQIGEALKALQRMDRGFQPPFEKKFTAARNAYDHAFSEERRPVVPGSELAVYMPIEPRLLYELSEQPVDALSKYCLAFRPTTVIPPDEKGAIESDTSPPAGKRTMDSNASVFEPAGELGFWGTSNLKRSYYVLKNAGDSVTYFQREESFDKQGGWNCGDIAVGINRTWLCDALIANANNERLRRLLLPELRTAAMMSVALATEETLQRDKLLELCGLHVALEGTSEEGCIGEMIRDQVNRNDRQKGELQAQALPGSMHTETLDVIIHQYLAAHETGMDSEKAAADAAFNQYLLNTSFFIQYVSEYYAKKGWMVYHPNRGGADNTSIFDAIAYLTKKTINIYRLDGNQLILDHSTESYDGETINVLYNGYNHFVRLTAVSVEEGIEVPSESSSLHPRQFH